MSALSVPLNGIIESAMVQNAIKVLPAIVEGGMRKTFTKLRIQHHGKLEKIDLLSNNELVSQCVHLLEEGFGLGHEDTLKVLDEV